MSTTKIGSPLFVMRSRLSRASLTSSRFTRVRHALASSVRRALVGVTATVTASSPSTALKPSSRESYVDTRGIDPKLVAAVKVYVTQLEERMYVRLRKGELEHRGEWETMTVEQLEHEIEEEVDDEHVYRAMLMFQQGKVPFRHGV